jgi:cytoskeletal protein CcmA (bactofilin family)
MVAEMTKDKLNIISSYLNNNRGIALITVMVLSTVLSLGAASFFVKSSQEAGMIKDRIDSTQALYAAEAAVEWAKYQLKNPDWWDEDGWTDEVSLLGEGDNLATTQVDFSYDGVKGTIVATGNFGNEQRRIVLELAPDTSGSNRSPFEKAVCSCNDLDITGNAATDSYSSSLGAYDAQPPRDNGHIGSNGDIQLNGNATIRGNVEGNGSLSGGSNNQITGDVTVGEDISNYNGSIGGTSNEYYGFDGDVCPCSAFGLDAAIAGAQNNNDNSQVDPRYLSGTDFSISGKKSTTLTAGTYYFTRFQITGQAKVNIDGEVIIYLDTGAEVSISGNGVSNSSDNAANLRIYTDTTSQVKITGNGDFSGAIFAPNSYQVKVSGNGDIYGAIVGNNVQLSGNGDIHYDEDAAAESDLPTSGPEEVGVDVISWREVNI